MSFHSALAIHKLNISPWLLRNLSTCFCNCNKIIIASLKSAVLSTGTTAWVSQLESLKAFPQLEWQEGFQVQRLWKTNFHLVADYPHLRFQFRCDLVCVT